MQYRDDVQLPPLSARSVVLSLLLGAHPPELPVRDLVRTVERFGVAETTVRAALSRMLAAGELRRRGTTYGLDGKLLERRRRQDDAITPATLDWDGAWEVAVVPAGGRSAAQRAELRADLTGLRLAELRDGTWLRPANLARPWPGYVAVTRFTARPHDDPAALAAGLWPLDGWAATAGVLLRHFGASSRPADRFTAAAGIVRHLRTDPALPAALLPAGWPAAELRAAYAGYRRELLDLVTA